MAYEKLIPSDARAPYFIYFDVEPAKIDVNIHPTKTEVRFEDEKAIFPILSAVVRETLGKSNSIPTIDFDQDDAPFIPALQTASLDKPQTPKVTFDPSYNPFKSSGYTSKKPSDHWEDLYQQKSSGFTFKAEEEPKTAVTTSNSAWGIETELLPPTSAEYKVMQWKKKYVVVLTEAAIQVFHQHRLHARILFEQYLKRMQQAERYSMPLLFPEVLELSVQENSLFTQVSEDLTALGFEFEPFGKTAYQITAIPEGLGDNNPVQTVLDTMELLQTNPSASKTQQKEWMAQTLAEKSAIKAGKVLTEMEMKLMVEQLANCQDTTYAPNGNPLSVSLNENEIENKLI
jgi:DNA mismatch repair protein MutL